MQASFEAFGCFFVCEEGSPQSSWWLLGHIHTYMPSPSISLEERAGHRIDAQYSFDYEMIHVIHLNLSGSR